MKKNIVTILLIIAIIFAGCSSGTENVENIESEIEVDVDSIQESVPSMEESIEEDFSTEVEDIELGELI